MRWATRCSTSTVGVALGRNSASVALHAVMTRQPITIREDQSLADALDSMYSNNFRHLPVVSEAGALVGACRLTAAVILTEVGVQKRAHGP